MDESRGRQVQFQKLNYCTLVAKSIGGTAQAPVLGKRAWDYRSRSELGRKLGRELGHGLRKLRAWLSLGEGVGVNATLLPA